MIKNLVSFLLFICGLTFLSGCDKQPKSSIDNAPLISANHTDATGKALRLGQPPNKIISLYPSITEILFELGAGNKVICVSEDTEIRWDDKYVPTVPFPSNIKSTVDTFKLIKPDVVFAIKDHFLNPVQFRDDISPIPVFFCELNSMEDLYKTTNILGEYINKSHEAGEWVKQMQNYVSKIESQKQTQSASCAIIVDYDPIRVIGGKHYLNDILKSCGGVNVFASKKDEFNTISIDELLKIQPEYVYIVTENDEIGRDLVKVQPKIKELKALKNEKMLTLNPSIFMRPNMRIFQAYNLFAAYMNPKLDIRKLFEESFPQYETEGM